MEVLIMPDVEKRFNDLLKTSDLMSKNELTDEELEEYMKYPLLYLGLKAKRLKPLLEAEQKRRTYRK